MCCPKVHSGQSRESEFVGAGGEGGEGHYLEAAGIVQAREVLSYIGVGGGT